MLGDGVPIPLARELVAWALRRGNHSGPAVWIAALDRLSRKVPIPSAGALSSQAPLIVCSATRRGGRLFDYDLRVEGLADPAEGGVETADLRAVSQWYTALLEQAIRRAPPQYWWVHRRWRGQPAQATVGRSAA